MNQQVKVHPNNQEFDIELQRSQPIKCKKKYGNVIPYLFIDGEPLIVIGPNCK